MVNNKIVIFECKVYLKKYSDILREFTKKVKMTISILWCFYCVYKMQNYFPCEYLHILSHISFKQYFTLIAQILIANWH